MGNVAQEYEDELLRSWEKPNEQISVMIFKNRKVDTVDNGRHSKENHEYWISRNGDCPYCRVGGKIIEEGKKP